MNIKHILLALPAMALLQTVKAQVTYQQTAKGLQYHIFTQSAGPKVKMSDVITFNVIQKTEKDSVLFSTYATGNPVKLQVQPSQNVSDMMDLFPLLAAKDSAIVKLPSDSVFKGHEQQRPPFLPQGSNLVFLIKVEKIQSLDEAMAERNAAIAKIKAETDKLKASEGASAQKYITDNKLVVKTTPSGLKYIITAPTVKHKPLTGDTVLVNYTGRTLDGKVFDSSVESVAQAAGLQQPGRNYEPIKLTLGQNQVIKGWEEGLLLVPEGGKAKLIIPSALAYGERGGGDAIKPYSTLVFDVELVKIKPGKHAAVKPGIKKTGSKTYAKKKTTVKKS